MKAASAVTYVSEIDPICALQACMEGFQVVTMEDDVVITTTGNKDIVTVEHMSKMRNNAIVGNIGHFANQTLAQLELRSAYNAAGKDKTKSKYQNKVYLLPKELDEKVARLHLGALGAKLTTLTKEQADYIGVPLDGPYKPNTYRY